MRTETGIEIHYSSWTHPNRHLDILEFGTLQIIPISYRSFLSALFRWGLRSVVDLALDADISRDYFPGL